MKFLREAMPRINCFFHLTDFQLDSPWGEDEVFFLNFWGESMALELDGLDGDALLYLIWEIEESLQRNEVAVKRGEIEELFCQPPAPTPMKLSFRFDQLGSLQALYQPSDHLWEMIFEDMEDGSQAVVMMSTAQVKSLLERLKRAAEPFDRG
jgi:hypothetical protein